MSGIWSWVLGMFPGILLGIIVGWNLRILSTT